jgi:hypothetical protein
LSLAPGYYPCGAIAHLSTPSTHSRQSLIPMSESNTPFNTPNEPSAAWHDPFTGMYEADSEINDLFNSLAANEPSPAVFDEQAFDEPLPNETMTH